MLTIALVGQKGGVGKSTIASILVNAALAKSSDVKVMLIETDEQKSSLKFHDKVISKYPDMAARFASHEAKNDEQLEAAFARAIEMDCDYILIDTAGLHHEFVTSVISVADKIVIPFRPTLKEYESQLVTLELYKKAKAAFEADGGSIGAGALVLNDWSDNKQLTAKQKEVLSLIFNEPMLADFFIPSRNSFETLDQGNLYVKELDEAINPLMKRHIQADLDQALETLSKIEAMQ